MSNFNLHFIQNNGLKEKKPDLIVIDILNNTVL